jgi:hypothetical protein
MKTPRVLVACEFSGRVRDAFIAQGCDAWSCDLLPTEVPGPHYQCDVRDVLGQPWDLMIAHPPCTFLALGGMRWYSPKWSPPEKLAARIKARDEALAFGRMLLEADVPRSCIEQPMSLLSSRVRRSDQQIQPWQFGHGEVKTTWLWLKNLPPLVPTHIVAGREERVHRMTGWQPQAQRAHARSLTFPGIARAMAEQWAPLIKVVGQQ